MTWTLNKLATLSPASSPRSDPTHLIWERQTRFLLRNSPMKAQSHSLLWTVAVELCLLPEPWIWDAANWCLLRLPTVINPSSVSEVTVALPLLGWFSLEPLSSQRFDGFCDYEWRYLESYFPNWLAHSDAWQLILITWLGSTTQLMLLKVVRTIITSRPGWDCQQCARTFYIFTSCKNVHSKLSIRGGYHYLTTSFSLPLKSAKCQTEAKEAFITAKKAGKKIWFKHW